MTASLLHSVFDMAWFEVDWLEFIVKINERGLWKKSAALNKNLYIQG